MEITDSQLKVLLLGMNMVTAEEFDQAAKDAEEKHIPLAEYLPQVGLVTDNHLGQLLASSFRSNFIDLSKERIARAEVELLPEAVARGQEAIIWKQDEKIHLATTNTGNYEFINLIARRFGKPVEVYFTTPMSLRTVLRQYEKSYGERIEKLLKRIEGGGESAISSVARDQDVVELVSVIMAYAHASRASDIHIEPLPQYVSVRFRIDGVLHELARYPMRLHEKIVSRIKIMSRLRTDEHAAPQDGRFSFRQEEKEGQPAEAFDVRVSILPIQHGENVVMRLLAERSQRLSLADLGFADLDLEKVKRAAGKPYGMILSVGPTGAGKTTTLYATLSLLNQPDVNIMTIEDPVEYGMEHVQQTQVNEKKNLTFATGLRSIVRQDPDIIMVGEIRDEDTAGIAVNAAMTGHLLLSTLHANDAATTFPRLFDLGVEPFLVASSVNVVVAQRLTRKVCEKCKTNYFLGEGELAMLAAEPELAVSIKKAAGKKDLKRIRFYRGAKDHCDVCGGTGYNGRIGIFEVMEVSERVRALIAQKASSDVITKAAREEGMTTMLEDGVMKMLSGQTTLEEIIRATKA